MIWQKTFGEMQTRHRHGESSSPVVYGDNMFINWDHDGPCFVAASVAACRSAMINRPEAVPFVAVWKLRPALGGRSRNKILPLLFSFERRFRTQLMRDQVLLIVANSE